MYDIIREGHSIIRWLLLAMMLFGLYWSWMGVRRGKTWGLSEARIVAGLGGLIDLQLALGFILYFVLSPSTTGIFSNLLQTVQTPGFLILGVFHPLAMIASAIVLHLIKPQTKKLGADKARFTKMGTLIIISLILILLAIPWF